MDRQVFDHHQRNAPLRSDGQPYSSFGLIWAHYGRDYLRAFDVPETHVDAIPAGFDADFVLPVDLMDNGALSPSAAGPLLADLTLPMLLESLKPVFDDRSPEADDLAFARALPLARTFVEATIARKAAKLRAEAMVLKAIAAAGLARAGTASRHAVPVGSGEGRGGSPPLRHPPPRETDWALTGIRLQDDGFEQCADLPTAWAGLTDAALEAASGVKGALFCHNARFIAVAQTHEAILEMARLALFEAEREIWGSPPLNEKRLAVASYFWPVRPRRATRLPDRDGPSETLSQAAARRSLRGRSGGRGRFLPAAPGKCRTVAFSEAPIPHRMRHFEPMRVRDADRSPLQHVDARTCRTLGPRGELLSWISQQCCRREMTEPAIGWR